MIKMNDIDKIKQLILSEQECNQRLGIELAKSQLGWGLNEIADIIVDKLKVCFESERKEFIDFIILNKQVSFCNGRSFSTLNGYTELYLEYYINEWQYVKTTNERNITDENKLIEMFKTDLLIELNNIL